MNCPRGRAFELRQLLAASGQDLEQVFKEHRTDVQGIGFLVFRVETEPFAAEMIEAAVTGDEVAQRQLGKQAFFFVGFLHGELQTADRKVQQLGSPSVVAQDSSGPRVLDGCVQ